MNIRFLGHAAFALEADGTTVLVDPFLSGNPKAAASADEVDPTHVFLTHGHQDHDEIDVALMCIGGHYTMDRFDAVVAAEFIGADTVIPCHYDTFPPIETDAEAFKSDVQPAGAAEVVVLSPGDTHTT